MKTKLGFTILSVLVGITVMVVTLGGALYVLRAARRAIVTISNARSNQVERVEQLLILTTNFDIGPINPDTGEVLLELPDDLVDSNGTWDFWRTTNWINYDIVNTFVTDKYSAQQMVYMLFMTETNYNVMEQCVFYGAKRRP